MFKQHISATVFITFLSFSAMPHNSTPAQSLNVAPFSLVYGEHGEQGMRPTMEDAHQVVLNLNEFAGINDGIHRSFFGIFDGHCGKATADYVAEHLHKNVASLIGKTNFQDAIVEGFAKTEADLLTQLIAKKDSAGSCAITAFIEGSTLFVANLGDSRAVLCKRGVAVALSDDHKPNRLDEMERIEEANSHVSFWGVPRVEGMAISRAFGDLRWANIRHHSASPILLGKPRGLIAVPEIKKTKITRATEFLLLACDGLWDVMTNQEAVDFVKKGLADGKSPEHVSKELTLHAINDRKSTDNVSAMIIVFKHNE